MSYEHVLFLLNSVVSLSLPGCLLDSIRLMLLFFLEFRFGRHLYLSFFLSLSCNYAHQFIPRYWPLFHFFSKSHPLMKVSQIHRWFTFYNPPNKSTYHDDYDRCFRIQTFKLYAHPSAKLSNTHGVVLKRMTGPIMSPHAGALRYP